MTATYWNGNGKFQQKAEEIGKFIPYEGSCEHPKLELFRVARNAYYDVYNNGACNPYRFQQLQQAINKSQWFEPFEDQVKSDKLSDFLKEAASNDRDFYLFTRDEESSKEEAETLEIIEELMDNLIEAIDLAEIQGN